MCVCWTVDALSNKWCSLWVYLCLNFPTPALFPGFMLLISLALWQDTTDGGKQAKLPHSRIDFPSAEASGCAVIALCQYLFRQEVWKEKADSVIRVWWCRIDVHLHQPAAERASTGSAAVNINILHEQLSKSLEVVSFLHEKKGGQAEWPGNHLKHSLNSLWDGHEIRMSGCWRKVSVKWSREALEEKDGGSLPRRLLSVSSVSCDFHINIWVTLNNLEACGDTTGCEAERRPATAPIVCVDLGVFQVESRIFICKWVDGSWKCNHPCEVQSW